MEALAAVVGPLLGLIIMLVKAYFDAKTAHQQEKTDAANKITAAVASGDASAINSAVQQLRR